MYIRPEGRARLRKTGEAWLMTLSLILPVGCATIHAKPSGYLTTSETFTINPDDPGLMTYRKQGANLSGYNSVIIEPVTWFPKPIKGEEITEEDAKLLAGYFGDSLKNSLEQDFAISKKRSSSTIRVRTAISNVDATSPLLNTLSLLILFWPMDRGSVSAEVEFLDSLTNERIGAMIFSRKGEFKEFMKGFSRFGRAKLVIDSFSSSIAQFLTTGVGNRASYSPIQ